MDPALEPFLNATDEGDEEVLLAAVLESARPILRRVAGAKMGGMTEELDDVCSEAQMELLLRLRRVKTDPVANRIDDFPAYVATVTGNACNRYFRARNPNRARLRNQIRYLLMNEPSFAIQDGPHPRCGLAGWNLDQNAAPPRNIEAVGDSDLAKLITAIFKQHQRPMTMDALVEWVARIWGIPARATVGLEERGSAELADPAGGREAALDHHRYAIRL